MTGFWAFDALPKVPTTSYCSYIDLKKIKYEYQNYIPISIANSNFQCFLVLAHDDITCMVCGQKIEGTETYDGFCKDIDDAGVEIECADEAGKSCMTSIISK